MLSWIVFLRSLHVLHRYPFCSSVLPLFNEERRKRRERTFFLFDF
uniref:Uncharacterized protein n=1 Tax=Populus trichocarpa TaxID=3694 RepID=A0A3N7FEG4_POPTR